MTRERGPTAGSAGTWLPRQICCSRDLAGVSSEWDLCKPQKFVCRPAACKPAKPGGDESLDFQRLKQNENLA